MSARPVVLQPADIVTLLVALDMLSSYALTQRTIALNADNKLKTAAMQAMQAMLSAIQQFAPADSSLFQHARHQAISLTVALRIDRPTVGLSILRSLYQRCDGADMPRMLAGTMVSTLLFSVLIMGPAYGFKGSLDWPRGWVVVVAFFLASALGGIYFLLTDPGLVRERAQVPQTKTTADTLATLLIFFCVVGFCSAAVYDGLQVQLLPLSSSVSLVAGVIVFSAGVAIVGWTFRVNSFATTIVEVQEARNQRVIETGPYRLVRHPMYFGAVWFFAGVALMLGSLAMCLAALIIFPSRFYRACSSRRRCCDVIWQDTGRIRRGCGRASCLGSSDRSHRKARWVAPTKKSCEAAPCCAGHPYYGYTYPHEKRCGHFCSAPARSQRCNAVGHGHAWNPIGGHGCDTLREYGC